MQKRRSTAARFNGLLEGVRDADGQCKKCAAYRRLSTMREVLVRMEMHPVTLTRRAFTDGRPGRANIPSAPVQEWRSVTLCPTCHF